MRSLGKKTMVPWAALAMLGVAGTAHGLCGDLNNDGAVNVADAIVMAQCTALAPGACAAVTCAGGLATCGDMFGDGDTTSSGGRTSDLDALVNSLAGIETLHDLCAPVGAERSVCTIGSNAVPPVSTITASEKWGTTCPTITINGTVFVESPDGSPTTVVTIKPGTLIQGTKGSVDPSALIFTTVDGNGDGIPDTNAKINAQGTSTNPIVFTSNQPDGSRAAGDWAGLVLNGRSTVNRPRCVTQSEGLPAPFGGCDPDNSSGIVRYVRVEYAGQLFTPNNELNAFTMNAVGAGTQIDHVQGHVGKDDCIEWFGGTVNSSYMVASDCADDGFDWQLGYTGALQFGLMLQNGNLTDPVNRDSRAFEGDNSEFGNNDLPRSNPDFCNVTAVAVLTDALAGSGPAIADNAGSDVGIFLRRGTAATIANTIIEGFQDAGLELRDLSTTQMACTDSTTLNPGDPNVRVKNTVFYGNGNSTGSGTEQCKRGDCVDGSNVAEKTACTGAGVPFACCTGAGAGCACNTNSQCGDATYTFCHIPNGLCSSCDFYNLLVASENVVPANGLNLASPPVAINYPDADGDLFDGRPAAVAGMPSATSCAAINENFVDTTYVGAFDPAASCTISGPGATCDWLSKPWISFDTN